MRDDNEYKYYINNNKLYRFHVETDEEPLNPRTEDDGNLGMMMCWHSRYNLGDHDENNFSSPEECVNELVRQNVKENTIINFIKGKKTSNGLELKYNRSEELWELWGYWYLSLFGERHEPKFSIIESNNPIDYLIDDMIDALSMKDKWKLLERQGIVFLPLYLYDHSGITMRTGSFGDVWDSGQVGFIYTSKKKNMESGCSIRSEKNGNKFVKVTNRNWKKAAYQIMEGEVEYYDMYLRGECYGYVEEVLKDSDYADLQKGTIDEDDLRWKDGDSCWGFYSELWGNELISFMAKENGVDKMYDSIEEVIGKAV